MWGLPAGFTSSLLGSAGLAAQQLRCLGAGLWLLPALPAAGTAVLPLEQLCWGALQWGLQPSRCDLFALVSVALTEGAAWVAAQDPHYPVEMVPLEPLRSFCICCCFCRRSCLILYSSTLLNWFNNLCCQGKQAIQSSLLLLITGWRINYFRKDMLVCVEEGFICSSNGILNKIVHVLYLVYPLRNAIF